MTLYAELRGMHYRVMTEKEIRVPQMWNSLWLYNLARGGRAPAALIQNVRDWLLNTKSITYGDAFDIAATYPAVQAVIASLILDGEFEVDWNKPVRFQSVGIRDIEG